MSVVVAVSVLGLAVVLFALLRDQPIAEPARPGADWDLIPAPAEIARVEFPLSFPGYDPAVVEMTFEALRAAYSDLLAAAAPETIARAQARAALRRGLEPAQAGSVEAALLPGPPPPQVPPATFLQPSDRDALRAATALAILDARG